MVNVESMEHFIPRIKDKDYVLDFQKFLEDYGVEVEGQSTYEVMQDIANVWDELD